MEVYLQEKSQKRINSLLILQLIVLMNNKLKLILMKICSILNLYPEINEFLRKDLLEDYNDKN